MTYDTSIQYITDLFAELVPDAEVQRSSALAFVVKIGDDRTTIAFSESEIEDFEIALERFQGTSYCRRRANG